MHCSDRETGKDYSPSFLLPPANGQGNWSNLVDSNVGKWALISGDSSNGKLDHLRQFLGGIIVCMLVGLIYIKLVSVVYNQCHGSY